MKSRHLVWVLAAVGGMLLAATAHANVVNGSLENNGEGWSRASYRYISPICSTDACTDTAVSGPRSGDYWAWFGRGSTDEVANVHRFVDVEIGKTYQLNYFLWVGDNESPTSQLEVFWDEEPIHVVTTDTAGPYLAGYTEVVAEIPGFTKNGTGHLMFFYSKGEDTTASYNVDDISISERTPKITDYTCTVPKLKKGTKLAKVKKELTKNHCRAKVKKKYSAKVKKGRLIKSKAKAGKEFTGGTKIQVIVSKGKKPR